MTRSGPRKKRMASLLKANVVRLLSGVALSAIAFTSPSHAENLFDALAAAYQSNPALLAQRAGLRATDEQVPQALSGWRPSLSATGSFGSVETDSISSIPLAGFGGKQTFDPMTGRSYSLWCAPSRSLN